MTEREKALLDTARDVAQCGRDLVGGVTKKKIDALEDSLAILEAEIEREKE